MKSTTRIGTTAASLLALALLAACSNPRTPQRLGGGGRIGFEESSQECDEVGNDRPFGQRFERFGELMVTEVQAQKEDFGKRLDVLGDEGRSYARQTSKEWSRTRSTLAAAPAKPFVDAGLHWDSLEETIGGGLRRAKSDARCFWSRAWRSLKMLE